MLAWFGAAAGSFVGAVTWRLKTGRDFVMDRSECERCHHKLGIADLIPVVSWIILRGKCRYCHKSIGWYALALELGVAMTFVASYAFWPTELTTWQAQASLAIWYVYIVALAALVASDLRWMILPDVIVFPLIALGLVDAGLRYSLTNNPTVAGYVWQVVTGAAALGGIYALLYFITKGRGVGFGDVKLGVFIGVVLGWQLALLVLMLANIVGFVCVLPGLLRGKMGRKTEVPFGQFLILGFIVAGLFGAAILDWYLRLAGL